MSEIVRPSVLAGFTPEDELAAQNGVCQATLSRARKAGLIQYAVWGGKIWDSDAGKAAKPTPETRYAVYDGTPFERAGAFQRDSASSFTAFDRRGRVIGVFDSQSAAVDAIEREASR